MSFRRVPAMAPAVPTAQFKSFPPPVRGWISNENLATTGPGAAYTLDNWFPTQTGIRLRGGCIKYATIGSTSVQELFTYRYGASEKFFASDVNSVFDITTVADPDIAPTADITGQTYGHYSTAMMTTTGGGFLICVNGFDEAITYDGSAWIPHDITGVDTDLLSAVWVYANRLFFIEENTLNAWYLPVDQKSGAAVQLPLNGIFNKGGSLLFGATWSLDSGDGLDDKCVFVTDQGEAAIYQGTDPSVAANWRLVGVYDITPPMGKNATMKAGGDLIIATEQGMVPISAAIQKDVAALSLAAVSRQIEPDWNNEVKARRFSPWHILKWPTQNMAVVALPIINETTEDYCFAVNLETGAWCRFTGWATDSVGLFDSKGYFGTDDGKICQMDIGGNDDGLPYTGLYVGSFDHLNQPGLQKTVQTARTIFRIATDIKPKISVTTDYNIDIPAAPDSIPDFTGAGWDVALWDVNKWDEGNAVERITFTKWVSIGRQGFSVAPVIQVTSGITPTPYYELVAFDLTYLIGGLQV